LKKIHIESSNTSIINEESNPEDKVRLYRSLFRGREDIYARFWQSRQTLKSGYSPVCKNEWNRDLCQKGKVQCNECNYRELAPLTDEVIQSHLDGENTVGIYPLLKDDSCCFLAIDFDKQSWMDDSTAFRETCQIEGLPAALERSRSGNGGHIWIFFTQTVPASAARNLGCYLLTQTMSRRHQLSMDSYDRLFPNQDTVPKGGFGNLIALPFQKVPIERGNTLFLDGNLNPYQNQWGFLESLQRVNPTVLEEIVHEAFRTGQVIGVRLSSTDEEDRPWTIPPSGKTRDLVLAGPFPPKVNLVESNLIFVEKSGLPSPLLNKIKRLAAFQNPEFYKKQKLRLSTFLTPRVIGCSEDFPQDIGIPRGCLEELNELLKSVNIKPELTDKRFLGTELKATFHGQLTSVQEKAAAELLRHDTGVLVAPPGSGKTIIGISIIVERKVNTLVLVHRRPLLEQWRTQLANFLDIDPKEIGQIGGGKEKRTGLLDVAMLQSLIKKGEVDDIVAEYGQIIVDECHHLPAVTFEQVLKQAKARYVLGLTATPYRRDGHHPIIIMQCGPVRYEIHQKDQKSQMLLQHHLVCRDTDFSLPPSDDKAAIHVIYAALMADEKRNTLILNDLIKSIEEGRSPILLTERREHLDFFSTKLAKHLQNIIVLRGGMGEKQRRLVFEQLAAIPEGEKRVLLATGRYIGEGFDDARLDTLFLALPVSWKGTLVQYAGRLSRMHSGKKEVRIYDYVDRKNSILMRMFQKRQRGYCSMGYALDEDKLAPDKRQMNVTLSLWDSLTKT
jgi:superfamily II DNA or RNA helicase